MHHLVDRATDTTCFWMSCVQLGVDTHSVMTMRLLGLGGAWWIPRDELNAMVAEKAPAFTEAILAGTLSAISGENPEQVGRAALAPLTSTARDNRVRLAGHGPRVPGLHHMNQ